MNERPVSEETVFKTKWFQVAARSYGVANDPHYVIHTNDFVVILAVTTEGKVLLVRQFRPAFGGKSLELPSGHIEKGETPEQAARKELLEETGHVAESFELLRTLSPCIGRFTNRMYCYYAENARPEGGSAIEEGIDLVQFAGGLKELLSQDGFESSLSWTALMAALATGRLKMMI